MRTLRIASWLLLAGGALAVSWVVVTWRWQDPVTALEARQAQGALATQLRHRSVARGISLAALARDYRIESRDGEAMGRIRIARLGLDAVLVDGTSEADLAKGPGIYARDYLPGEGRLVYVAGHRTTYSAPFARIDALRRGDVISLAMPYGTFRYAVTGHRIVPADDVAVLRTARRELLILQSCHPRFSASHRYLVYAVPLRSGVFRPMSERTRR